MRFVFILFICIFAQKKPIAMKTVFSKYILHSKPIHFMMSSVLLTVWYCQKTTQKWQHGFAFFYDQSKLYELLCMCVMHSFRIFSVLYTVFMINKTEGERFSSYFCTRTVLRTELCFVFYLFFFVFVLG